MGFGLAFSERADELTREIQETYTDELIRIWFSFMRKIMSLSIGLIFCDETLCMSSAVHTSGVLCNVAMTGSSRKLESSMRLDA